jgi:MFS family permease
MVAFAASNFAGPLLLGRLFDTVGRIPMIAGTYLASAATVAVLGLLLRGGGLTAWSFMTLVMAAFFFASAGASAAYLTVSEIFPMETRALAIAFFYALGTAVGGITGPLLFGQFIHSGSLDQVATGFLIGAGAMALGGVAELRWGVRAERQSLEAIAEPLTSAQRLRPGPGRGDAFYSPGMQATCSHSMHDDGSEREREVDALADAVRDGGATTRGDLGDRVGAQEWGPGRFRAALRDAVARGRLRRLRRGRYGPPATG